MSDAQQQGEDTTQQQSDASPFNIKVDLRRALLGGAVAAVVTLLGVWIVGRLSGAEAQQLTEATLTRLHALCNNVILASATILALMLTLLSLSTGASTDLKPTHYTRIRQLSFIDAIVFVAAMVVFLLLNIPIVEADKVPVAWFNTIYYTAIASASLLGGALVAIVMMLYNTVRDLIAVLGLGVEEHTLVDSKEESMENEP